MLFLSGLIRRLLGGWLSAKKIISERGIQWVLCFAFYYPIIYFNSYNTWLYELFNIHVFAILGSFSLIWCLTKGHFPGFQCGLESLDYINKCISEGRKIPFQKIVDWIANKRGFNQYDKEWCFWQLIINKTLYACVPALFFGFHFIIIGFAVALAYNAMFWVKLKPFRNILVTPTNWGEFWQGWLMCLGLFL